MGQMQLIGLIISLVTMLLIEQGFLRPTKHIIGHIGDDFYRSYDQTNSVMRQWYNKRLQQPATIQQMSNTTQNSISQYVVCSSHWYSMQYLSELCIGSWASPAGWRSGINHFFTEENLTNFVPLISFIDLKTTREKYMQQVSQTAASDKLKWTQTTW